MTDRRKGWKPIGTAPKDGTRVMLGWIANGMLEHEVKSLWRDGAWLGNWTPTHWMRPSEHRFKGVVHSDKEKKKHLCN